MVRGIPRDPHRAFGVRQRDRAGRRPGTAVRLVCLVSHHCAVLGQVRWSHARVEVVPGQRRHLLERHLPRELRKTDPCQRLGQPPRRDPAAQLPGQADLVRHPPTVPDVTEARFVSEATDAGEPNRTRHSQVHGHDVECRVGDLQVAREQRRRVGSRPDRHADDAPPVDQERIPHRIRVVVQCVGRDR